MIVRFPATAFVLLGSPPCERAARQTLNFPWSLSGGCPVLQLTCASCEVQDLCSG